MRLGPSHLLMLLSVMMMLLMLVCLCSSYLDFYQSFYSGCTHATLFASVWMNVWFFLVSLSLLLSIIEWRVFGPSCFLFSQVFLFLLFTFVYSNKIHKKIISFSSFEQKKVNRFRLFHGKRKRKKCSSTMTVVKVYKIQSVFMCFEREKKIALIFTMNELFFEH